MKITETSSRRFKVGVEYMGPMLWALLLVGCMEVPVVERAEFGVAEKDESIQGPVVQTDPLNRIGHLMVPFFPDDTDQCGPATLASLLTYWGVPTTPPALKEEIYLPRLGGTLPIDLLLAAQAHGLRAEFYSGSLDNVRAELEAGHPLVAFLNLGFAVFPQGHYVVITGFDDQRRGLYVHSGLEQDVFLPYERFLRSWEKTGRWTLLILPHPGQGRGQV
ncbi:MAG: C39 family peptidase [Nitrospiraceae bacterium]